MSAATPVRTGGVPSHATPVFQRRFRPAAPAPHPAPAPHRKPAPPIEGSPEVGRRASSCHSLGRRLVLHRARTAEPPGRGTGSTCGPRCSPAMAHQRSGAPLTVQSEGTTHHQAQEGEIGMNSAGSNVRAAIPPIKPWAPHTRWGDACSRRCDRRSRGGTTARFGGGRRRVQWLRAICGV